MMEISFIKQIISKRKHSQFPIYLCCILLFTILFSCEEEVKPLPTTGRLIKSFKLENGQVGNALLNVENNTVHITISSSVDLNAISPIITISDGATIFPASGEVIDVNNSQFVYIVKSASGEEQKWIVYFNVVDDNINTLKYSTFIIAESVDDKALGIDGDLLYNDKYWDHASMKISKNESFKWQKWHFIFEKEEGGERFFKIRNLFSGLYMTLHDDIEATNYTVLQDQLYSKNNDKQLWSLNSTSSTNYYIKSKYNGYLLSNIEDEITLTKKNENYSQEWHLITIPFEGYRDVEVQNFFRRNEPWMGSVAFDQGNSIPLTWGSNNGKVLWITEDAWDAQQMLYPDVLNGNSFFKYNNSIFVQESMINWNPKDAYNIINPDTRHPERVYQMMDVQNGMDWTWPGTGVEIGDKVYVYAGEGKGLEVVNNALYVLHQSNTTSWKVERETPLNVGGADGMVKGGDGYVYCYSHESNDGIGYNSDVFVRRFLEDEPLEDWTFWDGEGWSIDPYKKKAIASSKATTSVAKVRDKYLMMSMDMGFWCTEERNIYLSYSDSPVGPFSQRIKVYEIVENINGDKARFYTPIIHPWCINEHNELLLTYSLNFSACDQDDFYYDQNGNKSMNAYYYRLKAVRVPLSVVGF